MDIVYRVTFGNQQTDFGARPKLVWVKRMGQTPENKYARGKNALWPVSG
ncbi:MAG: hypothetical protein K0U84_03770 [Actinomycetia bacterium]|nr:hypothetical protein [Actinomycetes bacterium]